MRRMLLTAVAAGLLAVFSVQSASAHGPYRGSYGPHHQARYAPGVRVWAGSPAYYGGYGYGGYGYGGYGYGGYGYGGCGPRYVAAPYAYAYPVPAPAPGFGVATRNFSFFVQP